MEFFLLCMPWIGVGLYVAFLLRPPPSLPAAAAPSAETPFVSIIVPARNEEANIEACVSSLMGLAYPALEVLVVDDESQDQTRIIVRELADRSTGAVELIEGKPLPTGWLGKPWACWQGAQLAKGDLLLFTDADTVHDPDLLSRAIQGKKEEKADVLTILGRQVLGSFWERILQPQFFMLLAGRFPRVGVPRRSHQWRHAIANGQYLLFDKGVYREVGGHRAVAGDVVEDMRLAHIVVRRGRRLVVRGADGLRTRMYRSLGGLVEGWSKNVATAALQSSVPWIRPVVLPLSALVAVVLWMVPPVVLGGALVNGGPGTALLWGTVTTGVNVLIWSRASALMCGNPLFGVLYPLGSVLGFYIFLKSWWQGPRIRWKDRRYDLPEEVRKGSSAAAEGGT